MDFYTIKTKQSPTGALTVYPDFKVGRSKDLMVRGKSFYAVWDDNTQLWSTDEYDVQRIVDQDLHEYANNMETPTEVGIRTMESFDSKVWKEFRAFMTHVADNSHPLDETIMFENSPRNKTQYASKFLPYSLEEGPTTAWDELIGTLYSQEERDKIEWAIGAIFSGDSKRIQKFLVFYGPAGSGKSTILNIIQDLFEGYVAAFDAKALGSNNNAFATEVFRTNPLVAIQHDGDLSKIEDNTKLNSIVSHEDMTMNEKYKPSYTARVNAFLLMGTNEPVKISNAKSGIIRRLIDVQPSGHKIASDRYLILMSQIKFELGYIAQHCLNRYNEMGKNYYQTYKPVEMMLQTDVFYNFIESYFDVFKKQDGISLRQAYAFYKEFCLESNIDRVLPLYKFREELRNYFETFHDRMSVDGVMIRSYYTGFITKPEQPITKQYTISFDQEISLLDDILADEMAQYAKDDGFPMKKWVNVKSTLSSLDTTKLHFVQVPESHIVIDFDLVDENGNKDFTRNLMAASKWPPTYAEVSKSGAGIHLHYLYNGDVEDLSGIFEPGIEVKTLLGGSSLRRKLSKCNNLPVATISSGLPKKEKPVLDIKSVASEKGLRELINRNLRKEIHPGTKPSIDFILKILDDAYESGLAYDVSDMRSTILTFAFKSSNQAEACVKLVDKMKFASVREMPIPTDDKELPLVFFDVEVYPNLFVVCWKYEGSDTVVKMINPTPSEIEDLFALRLVGFNNRRYDNHILYARFLGFSLEELYNLSSKIVNNDRNCYIREAYNVSFADIYDFSSKKQGLKKFQIELGIRHLEMDLPWDQPVDEEHWPRIVEYCANDVISTEAVFNSRAEDFMARQILADLSGLSANHSTQAHTAKIIFGDERAPQAQFIYTNLSEMFPGYEYSFGKSTYRGEVTGEGGYVYAEPGIYNNVALLDVASMHPTSIAALDLFGPYTKNFVALTEARLAVKRRDYDLLSTLLDGKLTPFISRGDEIADGLSFALKIVINTVYGLTSASFDTPFKDPRNIDNIVAKRGALFMVDLKHEVQERGFIVAHIKTDSIKIPDATPEIIEFVNEFGKKYGYTFEHEGTYDAFCLVNDAVYVAKEHGQWSATGAQFQHPYVFKKLFTDEDIVFEDLCATKSVKQGAMYLDFEGLDEIDLDKYVHVGRTGSFVPVTENGGTLYRVNDDKRYAVAGTKGYKWIDREVVTDEQAVPVDMEYFETLRLKAIATIEAFGSYEDLVAG